MIMKNGCWRAAARRKPVLRSRESCWISLPKAPAAPAVPVSALINRAVDLAIAPTSDEAQWGVADHWSPPFETLQSHRGDCEDYAIVKYVALLQAGLPHEDVRIVILRNILQKEDHAALAARVDGQWLILDNCRLALVRDTDMVGSIPKFVLDEGGARRFVPRARAGQGPSAGRSSPAHFVRPA